MSHPVVSDTDAPPYGPSSSNRPTWRNPSRPWGHAMPPWHPGPPSLSLGGRSPTSTSAGAACRVTIGTSLALTWRSAAGRSPVAGAVTWRAADPRRVDKGRPGRGSPTGRRQNRPRHAAGLSGMARGYGVGPRHRTSQCQGVGSFRVFQLATERNFQLLCSSPQHLSLNPHQPMPSGFSLSTGLWMEKNLRVFGRGKEKGKEKCKLLPLQLTANQIVVLPRIRSCCTRCILQLPANPREFLDGDGELFLDSELHLQEIRIAGAVCGLLSAAPAYLGQICQYFL